MFVCVLHQDESYAKADEAKEICNRVVLLNVLRDNREHFSLPQTL